MNYDDAFKRKVGWFKSDSRKYKLYVIDRETVLYIATPKRMHNFTKYDFRRKHTERIEMSNLSFEK